MADKMPGGTRIKVHRLPPPAVRPAVAKAAASVHNKSGSKPKRSTSGRDSSGSAKSTITPAALPSPTPIATSAPAAGVITSSDPARDALLRQIDLANQALDRESQSGFGQRSKDAATHLEDLNKQLGKYDSDKYARERERAGNESLKMLAEVAAGTTAGVLVARSVGRGEIEKAKAVAAEIKTLAGQAKSAMAAGGNQANKLTAIVNQANRTAGVKAPIVAGRPARPMPSSLGASKNFKLKANAGIAVALATDAVIGRFIIPKLTDDPAVQEAARITANTATAATVAFIQTRKIQNASAGKVGPAAKDLATLEAAHNQITTGKADKAARKGPSVKAAVAEAKAEAAAEAKAKTAAKSAATRRSNELAAAKAAGVKAGKRAAKAGSGKPNPGWSDAAREASAEVRTAKAASVAEAATNQMLVETLAKKPGAKAMAGLSDFEARLGSLKGDALRQVAEDMGVRPERTAKATRNAIVRQISIRVRTSQRVVQTEGLYRDVDPAKVSAARDARLNKEGARLTAAIDKVTRVETHTAKAKAYLAAKSANPAASFDELLAQTGPAKAAKAAKPAADVNALAAPEPKARSMRDLVFERDRKIGSPLAPRSRGDLLKNSKYGLLGPIAVAGAAALAFDAARNQAAAEGKTAGEAITDGAVSGVAAATTVAATGFTLMKALQLAAKAAPVVAGVAAKVLPAAVVAGAVYETAQGAIEGYKEGGVTGALKGAAMGAADFATMGAVSHFVGSGGEAPVEAAPAPAPQAKMSADRLSLARADAARTAAAMNTTQVHIGPRAVSATPQPQSKRRGAGRQAAVQPGPDGFADSYFAKRGNQIVEVAGYHITPRRG